MPVQRIQIIAYQALLYVSRVLVIAHLYSIIIATPTMVASMPRTA